MMRLRKIVVEEEQHDSWRTLKAEAKEKRKMKKREREVTDLNQKNEKKGQPMSSRKGNSSILQC